MLYQLYLIENKINHKKYVGQTNQEKGFQHRFEQHCCEAGYSKHPEQSILHKAIRHYGKENFDVKLLLHDIPEDKIDYYEMLWIKKLHTFVIDYPEIGYNMTEGGQGVHGYRHTEETKAKLSTATHNHWETLPREEYIRLCNVRAENMKGRSKSLMHRKNLSAAAKKRFEHCPGTFTGRSHSAESKELIALANGNPVAALDKNSGETIKTFASAMKATEWLIENGATTNHCANSRILEICNGHGKSAYGYGWKRL